MKRLYFIFIVSLGFLVSGCGSDARQSTRIPPLPSEDMVKRAKTGIEYLTVIIGQNESSPFNYYKRAELYFVLRNWKEALQDIDQALEISPSNGLFLLTRARVLKQLRRYDEALEAAQRAEVLHQDTPELYVLLGDLTQQKRQFDESKLYLSKALQMAPYDGEGHFYSGMLNAYQGDTLSGIVLMQRALELKPRFMPAYSVLTTIYTRLREYDQARALNNQGLRYFPKESALHYARGTMYQAQKRLDSALISYRKAIVFDTTNYIADFQAGTIYLKWYSYPQAIRSFQKVLRYDPKYPQINFLLGTAYDKTGNLEEAVEQYTLATQADANDWRSRGRLYRAQQRKYYLDTYGMLPPAAAEPANEIETEEIIPEKTLDPERIKIDILVPKREIKTKIDTVRSFKIK